MATLYITELNSVPFYNNEGIQIASHRGVTAQTVAISGSSTQSSAFQTNTKYIRLNTDATCSYAIGSNPTASATSARLPANAIEYVGVSGGDKIAIISNT